MKYTYLKSMAVKYLNAFSICVFFAIGGSWIHSGGAQDQRREEKAAAEYFDKWLTEDVVYIISDEERDVFAKLSTPEEKEQFIEQFWKRRDPTQQTALNEFKEEHYRRIAYANERFASGYPGWRTDRGRIYIMFGPPHERIRRPSAGPYMRRPYEGGGATVAYPFEVWRYTHIPGAGTDVEIEFVDKSFTGDYKIAFSSDEKDALSEIPGVGLKHAELRGLYDKYDRFVRQDLNYLKAMGTRYQDMPFERLIRYAALQKPPEINFEGLREVVTLAVHYNDLPFDVTADYLSLNSEQAVVLINFEIPNSKLQYEKIDDRFEARLNLYGQIQALNGAQVRDFEDSVASFYSASEFSHGRKMKSVYQKILILSSNLYKLTVVAEDVKNGNLGTRQIGLKVPNFRTDRLTLSSLVLGSVEFRQEASDREEMFLLGNVKVVPNVERKFTREDDLGIYVQVYNAGVDGATQESAIEVEYRFLQDGTVVKAVEELRSDSFTHFADGRVVVARILSIDDLPAGTYQLELEVKDRITGLSTSEQATFTVS